MTFRFLEGNSYSYLNTGLPDIQGYIDFISCGNAPGLGVFRIQKYSEVYNAGTGTWWKESQANFSAAYSNSIYGNSVTVQPVTCFCRFLIKY